MANDRRRIDIILGYEQGADELMPLGPKRWHFAKSSTPLGVLCGMGQVNNNTGSRLQCMSVLETIALPAGEAVAGHSRECGSAKGVVLCFY